MGSTPKSAKPQGGFSLIELLVVMIIITILALGVNSLTPKTPTSVKAGIVELRGAILQARSLALSTGRPVTMEFDPVSSTVTFRQVNDDGTLAPDPPMGTASIRDAWSRHAKVSSTLPMVTGETKDPAANTQINFNFKADGWKEPMVLSDAVTYGFSPTGKPEKVVAKVRTPLFNGTWIGLVGNTPNRVGRPYGVVLINDQGMVTSFYKADSQFDEGAEYTWRRLD